MKQMKISSKAWLRIALTAGLILPQVNFAESSSADVDIIGALRNGKSQLVNGPQRAMSPEERRAMITKSIEDIGKSVQRSSDERSALNLNLAKIKKLNEGDKLMFQADEDEINERQRQLKNEEKALALARSMPRQPEVNSENFDSSGLSDACSPNLKLEKLLDAHKHFGTAFSELSDKGADYFSKRVKENKAQLEAEIDAAYLKYKNKKPRKPEEMAKTEALGFDKIAVNADQRLNDLKAKGEQYDKELAKQDQDLGDRYFGPEGYYKKLMTAEDKSEELKTAFKEFKDEVGEKLGNYKKMFLKFDKAEQARHKAIIQDMELHKANAIAWLKNRDMKVDNYGRPQRDQQGNPVSDTTVLAEKTKEWDAAIARVSKFQSASAAINKEFKGLEDKLAELDKTAASGSKGRMFADSKNLMFALSKTVNKLGQELNKEGGPIDSCETASGEHMGLIAEEKNIKEQAKQKMQGQAGPAQFASSAQPGGRLPKGNRLPMPNASNESTHE